MQTSSEQPLIYVISSGNHTIIQSLQLAHQLTTAENIVSISKYDEIPAKNFPSLAIGAGFSISELLVSLKKKSHGKTKIAIIFDPLKHYEDFDFIILPSYEPYKLNGKNIIRTTGLINFVNENYLARQKNEYETHSKYQYLRQLNLKPPFLSVMIGGKHTGGNIEEVDARALATKINTIIASTGGSALITTSPRTEPQIADILQREVKTPYFLYDYKKREVENPYGPFLSLATEIIVTGESARMISECCTTGKKTRIYRPKKYGFQYKPLIDELIANNHAVEFDDEKQFIPTPLNEASRVAELIAYTITSN